MRHPSNKYERNLIGKLKGIQRTKTYKEGLKYIKDEEKIKKILETEIRNREDTTKPCSCVMCGNPRKHFGEITRQEAKNDERFNSDLDDYNAPLV